MSSFQVENLFNVKDKVVLVTGGSRGIGKMIATGFIRNGAKVYISSRSAKSSQLHSDQGNVSHFLRTWRNTKEVERVANDLAAKEPVLHVLVNNAGAAWGDSLDDFPDAAFSKVLTLNLQRVFTLTQKLLPLLRAAAALSKDGETFADPARIINIGSVEGIAVPIHETYAYSASKAALHHLSRHLGGRLGPEGIVSNTIACGPFPTKMTAHSLEAVKDVFTSTIPLRRLGKPEDVAGAALFLASPAGAFVNGATITLDGGMLVSMTKL
ncbi:NAD-P-binding protein [Desarmillaria tabescens]|uniref:NAD-P-binding protein n=1 Tax=Armillaria tabescens TaxID=1929756 RepID=A0AA39NG15_ARMTA|nr:NAD-P-binding protein [Desarmillaria tabescens]KAK0464972.1 NAD-P-binding protein [Desarmillaria tabescens]